MRLFAGSLLLLLAPLALAGGAYLKQDITGRWHYPEWFPPEARADTSDEAGDGPADDAVPAAAPRTPEANGRKRVRTAQHP